MKLTDEEIAIIRARVVAECHDRIMAAVPVSPPADQAESMWRMGLREAARLVNGLGKPPANTATHY